ncbi:hypothetical protein FA95DRAFT_1554758 [Auriscalpium vulgare]|uniref:Uncharacterized protein n=1 Tax=Auriscalpium vulgare TaxID=40419 RepID=A0ACB8S4A0_9AGAM|nr:hypothetical protein FA95DRAFT_1554758 [Auriscalpium vulgare]
MGVLWARRESCHGVAVPKRARKGVYKLHGAAFDAHMAALLAAGLEEAERTAKRKTDG